MEKAGCCAAATSASARSPGNFLVRCGGVMRPRGARCAERGSLRSMPLHPTWLAFRAARLRRLSRTPLEVSIAPSLEGAPTRPQCIDGGGCRHPYPR
jgi:hypothetical protein